LKGLATETAAIRGVLLVSSFRYFTRILAPKLNPTAINGDCGNVFLVCIIASRKSSVQAAVVKMGVWKN
jgi:hypothetical protein